MMLADGKKYKSKRVMDNFIQQLTKAKSPLA